MTVSQIDEVSSDRGRDGIASPVLPRWVGARFHALVFWSAIVLPVLYLPLLFAGIDDTRGLLLFLGLFGLHVLALVGGRTYGDSSAS